MDIGLILLLIVITVLFGLSNLAYLNSNSQTIEKLYRIIYYGYIGIFVIELTICLFLINDELSLLGKVLYIMAGVVFNPLLIIFPLSNLQKKISPKVKKILSGIFLVVYSFILLIGLIGMTTPGNTWGNSSLFEGFLCAIWSLPNILLATIMSNDFKFTGITKLITGLASLIIILITMRGSDYTADTEHIFRTITFMMCGYFTFEGYLFVAKHQMMKI